METEPDCLHPSFLSTTPGKSCGCVLRRRDKQKDTQNKVGYRHTRSQHRVRSSPKHNYQPDIRGGTAIRVRRERERGGTRHSASTMKLN